MSQYRRKEYGLTYKPWPKRNPIKNCFLVPNEIFQLKLHPSEIAVYGYLLFCENRKTYQCYPSYKTIGNAVGMSFNTVKKYVTKLKERKLISTEPTIISSEDGQPRNGTLLYTIRPIQEALDYDQERRLLEFDAKIERQETQKLLKQYKHECEDGDSA